MYYVYLYHSNRRISTSQAVLDITSCGKSKDHVAGSTLNTLCRTCLTCLHAMKRALELLHNQINFTGEDLLHVNRINNAQGSIVLLSMEFCFPPSPC